MRRFVFLVLVLGCDRGPTFKPTITTPCGVQVDTQGQLIDVNAVDQAVDKARQCYGPIACEKVKVRIRKDWFVAPDDGLQYFECGLGTQKLWCAGQVATDRKVVEVTPSLSALDHELGHIITSTWWGEPVCKESASH